VKPLVRSLWKSPRRPGTLSRRLSRSGALALLLAIVAVLETYAVAAIVFQGEPHTEDEIAYLWQADVFAGGRLTEASPPLASQTFVPFVVDYHGQRFSKYPPGWPAVLALGAAVHAQSWVNPLLAGLAVLLTYALGKQFMDARAGLVAATLTLASPFFLLNSGSFLSSSLALVLTGLFVLCWLKAFFSSPPSRHRTLYCVLAGVSLGWLALTRPLTALAVGLPFGVHGLSLLWKADREARLGVLLTGAIAALCAGLLLAWQYRVTGSPLRDPYTLWWSFDKIGFGPGTGIKPGGHTPLLGLQHAAIMLASLSKDLFGWGRFAWVFLPLGLWALRKDKRGWWLVAAIFPSLVIAYVAYWAYVTRFGPRYYYEGLYALTLGSAAGILWLARRGRPAAVLSGALVAILVGYNFGFYLPGRLSAAHRIYSISPEQLVPFEGAQARALTPALVIVHLPDGTGYRNLRWDWPKYGGLLELENPALTSPFVFALSSNAQTDRALAAAYPDRKPIYYYVDQPARLYFSPRSYLGASATH
jgi:hypothetical protein